ncbi:MAG: cyclic lactone autoinducer peptide [Oscillospiraceae bacterium]|nr:cyclic lactone autoinducer peptide [Oscillospiraceae bacterium]
MYRMMRKLAYLTLLLAAVASKVPCWGPNYQPVTPSALK